MQDPIKRMNVHLRLSPPIHALCLTLILLLGFALRAAGVTWGQAYNYGSQGDCIEAYEVAVAYELGDAQAQYLGQPNFKSGSKLPGPAWTLFCVLGLKSWGSIEGVCWLLVITNVAAIYFIYLLAAKTVGPDAGLVAALLVATSPPAIHLSIPAWNPGVMVFLSTLLFLALWRVVQNDRSRSVAWVPFILFLMPQFHLSGLLLIPAVAVTIWIAGRPLSKFWLAAGCVAGLALYIPYFAGELAHDFGNTRAMLASPATGYPADAIKAFTAPISFLLNYWTPRWIYTPAEYREMCRSAFGGVVWVWAIGVLSSVIALMLVVRTIVLARDSVEGVWRSPRMAFARSPGMIFLLVLYLTPLVTGLAVGESFRPRYCLFLLGPLFSLAGAAAVSWLSHHRFQRAFAFAGVALVVCNAWFMIGTYRFQGRHIEQAPRFFGSFRHLEEVYQSLLVFAGDGHAVAVDDSRLRLPTEANREQWYPNAKLIRRYVTVRETERARSRGISESGGVVYDLLAAQDLDVGRNDVAFSGNGIVLVLSHR